MPFQKQWEDSDVMLASTQETLLSKMYITLPQKTNPEIIHMETCLEWNNVDDGLKAILELRHFNKTVATIGTH